MYTSSSKVDAAGPGRPSKHNYQLYHLKSDVQLHVDEERFSRNCQAPVNSYQHLAC
jgi:hypothetical protein